MSRLRSLTARLALTAVALVAVVSLLIGVATTLVIRASLTDRLDRDLSASLDRAAHLPSNPLLPNRDRDGRGDRDDRPAQDLETITVYFYDDYRDPVGFYLTPDPQSGLMVEPVDADVAALIAKVPRDGQPHNVDLGELGHYRLLGTNVGQDRVVGQPIDQVEEAVETVVIAELLLGLIAVLLAAVAATLLVRRQLRPLREVAGTAHRVAELPLATGEIDLADRVPAHLTDERTEVGQVGAALNSLLEHVEASLEARQRSELQVRQFVADASHELRTPLATISGYTELARRHPDDVATAATALDKVHEESNRMTGLVEDLLLLARLDSGRPLERTPVDLTRLLLEAVSDARVVAPDHAWRLELPDQAVEVPGDAQRLHQVLTNLLTNARKHTPAGTTVTVAARPDGFSVHDDGPGFPPALLGTAFERFTRGDDARTRSPEGIAGAGGAGLGLSLVHAIVLAHGGRVTLDSTPGDTTITVILPTDR